MTWAVQGLVSGKVQGVGFRFFVRQQALPKGIHGYAKNLADGRVEVLLVGDSDAVQQLQRQVEIGPDASRVDNVAWTPVDPPAVTDFAIG